MIRRWVILVALGMGLSLSSFANAQEALVNLAPFEVNAISLVKVRALIDSPLGKKHKWLERVKEAYATGMISAPPYVDEVLRGADVRPNASDSHPSWVLFRTRTDGFMNSIAKHEGVKSEKLGDAFGVDSPRGIYFVQLASRTMGAVHPGDRQLATKWVRQVKSGKTVALSERLVNAIQGSDAQVILAADTTDMLDATRMAGWLRSLPADKIGDPKAVSEILASLQDVILSIQVTDTVNASLKIDFEKPIGTHAASIGAAIRTWLEDIGAHVETVGEPKITVTDKTIHFTSAIDEASLKRILTLIRTPTIAPDMEASDDTAANPASTKRYYQAVVGYVEDLLRMKQKNAGDYKKTTMWHDTYARKIEDLSVAGVDGDVQQWGYQTAKRLRALAASLRGLPVEINDLERKIRTDFKPWYVHTATTPWGYHYTPQFGQAESNESEIRGKQQDAVDSFAKQRDEIWDSIEKDRVEVVDAYKAKTNIDVTAK
jgi:hypothetical protein